jgi:hypothetical protein
MLKVVFLYAGVRKNTWKSCCFPYEFEDVQMFVYFLSLNKSWIYVCIQTMLWNVSNVLLFLHSKQQQEREEPQEKVKEYENMRVEMIY